MAAVLTSIVRGAVGVAASVLLVAVAWTLYLHRDEVGAASAPLVDMLVPAQPTPAAADPRPLVAPEPAATAPSAGSPALTDAGPAPSATQPPTQGEATSGSTTSDTPTGARPADSPAAAGSGPATRQ
jgi:hypothetical protein